MRANLLSLAHPHLFPQQLLRISNFGFRISLLGVRAMRRRFERLSFRISDFEFSSSFVSDFEISDFGFPHDLLLDSGLLGVGDQQEQSRGEDHDDRCISRQPLQQTRAAAWHVFRLSGACCFSCSFSSQRPHRPRVGGAMTDQLTAPTARRSLPADPVSVEAMTGQLTAPTAQTSLSVTASTDAGSAGSRFTAGLPLACQSFVHRRGVGGDVLPCPPPTLTKSVFHPSPLFPSSRRRPR